ncbi:hypothetical protein C8Q80DRAFT_1273186 [Daedaleopsis nitida]|nr:hypothetical protein C8Q80DRAFT_1273186 [Daedaleopsis nitida]
MEGLLSQHPSPHQFPLPVDPHSYQSRSTTHAYPQKLPYPPHTDSALYDQSFHHNQPRFPPQPHALQIHTAAPAPHEHDPEEQTAHPSRASSYAQLTHDVDHQEHQSIADALTDNSAPNGGLSRPLTMQERDLLSHLDRLKFFLATAPSRWNSDNGFAGPDPSTVPPGHPHSSHPALNRFALPNSEYVSCVLWGGLYHITGTDIVRALVFRFEAFGRPVRNMKKFEEGVFSDLRNLKPGVDACLEEPKSPFLDLLFKYQCIRTQKKQKVFYWFSVPHDRLFLDALERDLKREKMGLEPTTVVSGEPALSFTYDPKRSLYEQFAKAQGRREGEGELEAAVRHADEAAGSDSERASSVSDADHSASETDDATDDGAKKRKPKAFGKHSPFFSMFSLFEGSPTYKQRRKKVPKSRKSPTALDPAAMGLSADEYALGYYQEPHLDRFGRETVRLSAEDMFRAQARGDFGGQSNPDIIATQKERQRRALEAITTTTAAGASAAAQAKHHTYLSGLTGPGVTGGVPAASAQGVLYNVPTQVPNVIAYAAQQQQYTQQQMGGRPHLEQRHTYPLLDYASQQPHPQQHMPARSDTDPYGLPQGWSAEGMLGVGAPARTKAFVCPLFSCGRMFKRMEHLKRHLRTHTLERPFQCERCKKRFSRSDNLAQHVRTHDRRVAAAASGLPAPEGEQEAEEEMLDELEADDIDGQLQYLPGVKGITSVQMCEVEVQGQVHDVQGDEEGLVTTTGSVAPAMAVAGDGSEQMQQQQQAPREMFYDPSGHILRASPESSPYMAAASSGSPEAQWATLSQHPSPASSAASTFTSSTQSSLGSGLQQQQQQQQRMDASYHTHLGEYVTSISAPSHKLTFDHGALYPAESATPSIARYGESIRRPYSAALSESAHAHTHTQRAYHPYAIPGHAHAHHGGMHAQQQSLSAQSSPMAYPVPLGYDAGAPHPHPHPHSRSSSSGGGLQEQMHQMLSLEAQQQPEAVAAAAVDTMAYGPQMYRTDSPMQFAAAGSVAGAGAETYEMEVAQRHRHRQRQQQQQQQQHQQQQHQQLQQQQQQHQQQQQQHQQQQQQQQQYAAAGFYPTHAHSM